MTRLGLPLMSTRATRWLGARTSRRARAGWLVAFIAAAIASIAAVAAAVSADARLDGERAELARMERRLAPIRTTSARPGAELAPLRANALRQVVQPLNVPWSNVFDALEAATPDDVALVAVEPDARRRAVRLLVEAESTDALFAYVHALERQAAFEQVALAKHETQEQDPQRPVRFTIDAPLAQGVAGAAR